ncbi:MAG TPA: dephospho-CoA kinase [Candidatus Nanopelagicaceae bacterium]|nr:dephospho-CoA kinase [Candidatus Nanopelagicaceae bacterium]
MLLIALTGGIGSGKSTAAQFLHKCGAEVIEADLLAQEVLEAGSPGLMAVKAHFGAEIIEPTGALNREALARIVFADPDKRKALEGIVHPLVETSFRQRIAALPKDAVVIYEIPLLVETGRADEFQLVIVIETPLSVRLERMTKRGLTQNQAMARISGQASNEDRRAIADIVLTNSSDVQGFENELALTWNLRLLPFAENLATGRGAEPEWMPVKILPNVLPIENQVVRIANRVAKSIEGKVSVCSMTELQIKSELKDPAESLKHLGFIEVEPMSRYVSADPGRPLRLVVARK